MPEDAVTLLMARLEQIEGRLAEMGALLRREKSLPEQEWFSIEEVSAITGLSVDHVRRHVNAGTLPVSNQGTFEKPYYRVRRADIDAWMAQRMKSPGPAPRKKSAGAAGYKSRHHHGN